MSILRAIFTLAVFIFKASAVLSLAVLVASYAFGVTPAEIGFMVLFVAEAFLTAPATV